MYLCLYFLKFILSIYFWRTTLETSVLLCALMCLSSVNIIFICIMMFHQINSLTHINSQLTQLNLSVPLLVHTGNMSVKYCA